MDLRASQVSIPGKEFGLSWELGEAWFDVQCRETDGMASVESVWEGDIGRPGRMLWVEGVGCPR